MSEMATLPSFYVVGGTMKPDAPSYVQRNADRELFDALHAGKFCYVLTSRQMGKSSLVVRVDGRLREDGVAVARLDLQKIGKNITVEQWYSGLLLQLGKELRLKNDLLEAFWQDQERTGPLQRWMQVIREVALERVPGRIVIFVDEIDYTRSLDFSTDEFFAGIREFYNRRAYDPELERLTFCLLGVATPSDLIRDVRTTPFNIGQRIELSDFTEPEAEILLPGFQVPREQARKLLARILYWTGGHPYLTQRLCQSVSENAAIQTPEDVDKLCASLYLTARARTDDNNLIFVRDRMLNSTTDPASVLDHYDRVRRGKPVRDDQSSPPINVLRLSGITRVVDGFLQVRNRIYEHVFDHKWVLDNMPDAELRRQKAAVRKAVLQAVTISAVILLCVGWFYWRARQAQKAAEEARAYAEVQKQIAESETARQKTYAKILKQHDDQTKEAFNRLRGEGLRTREKALDDLNSVIVQTQSLIERAAPEDTVYYRDLKASERLRQGNPKEAILEATAALKIAPDYPAALETRGYAYLLDGKPDLALADFDRSLGATGYSNTTNNFNRAVTLAILGRRVEAEKALAFAMERNRTGRDVGIYEADISPDITRATGRTAMGADGEGFRTAMYYLKASLEAYTGGSDFERYLKEANQKADQLVRPTTREDTYLVALQWAHYQDKFRPQDFGAKAIGGALWERLGYVDWAGCYYEQFEEKQKTKPQARYAALAQWVHGQLGTLQRKRLYTCDYLMREETDPHALEQRAREALSRNQMDLAEQQVTKAIEKEPRDATLLLLRARVRNDRGREFYQKRNVVQTQTNELASAIENLKKQMDQLKKHMEGASAQTPAQGAEEIGDTACPRTLIPAEKMKCLLGEVDQKQKAMGVTSKEAGRLNGEGVRSFQEAGKDCNRILVDLKRPSPSAYFYRGLAGYRLQTSSTASAAVLNDFREALRHDPDNGSAMDWLSFLLAQEKDDAPKKEALGLLERYNFLNPGSAGYLARMANLLNHFKRFAEALRSIDTAIVIEPEVTSYYDTRAEAQRGLGISDAQIAREKAAGYTRASDILRQRGDQPASAKAFQNALQTLAPQADLPGNEMYRCNADMSVCMESRVVKVNGEYVVGRIESMVEAKQDAVPGIPALDRVQLVRIDRGSDDGLVAGAEGEIYSNYSKADNGHERKTSQIGQSEVVEVKPQSALVRVTLSDPKDDGLVRVGDLVALRARAPKMEKRSPLWSLARYHIGILSGDGKKEYVDYRKLYKDESPQVVDGIEQDMLKEIHGIPALLDAKAAGTKLDKGTFAGKTTGEALAGIQKPHLEVFLGFLLNNRSYFAGHNYQLPRVFRAWVEAGAPAE